MLRRRNSVSGLMFVCMGAALTCSLACSGGSSNSGAGGENGSGTGGSNSGGDNGMGGGSPGLGGSGVDAGSGDGNVGTDDTNGLDPTIIAHLTFDDPKDLTDNFVIPEGADAAHLENGALVIDYDKPRTLIFDRQPDGTPTNALDAPLTISFRFKANTTDIVPLTSVSNRGDLGNPRVWVAFFGDQDRKNAARVSLRWSEIDEEVLRFETGVDFAGSKFDALAAPASSVFEWTPLFNGDQFYKMKVVLRRLQGDQLKASVELTQDEHLLMRRSYTFTQSQGAGEIAIGGDSGKGQPGQFIIDDVEIRSVADDIPDETFTRIAINNLAATLYLPPGVQTLRGVYLNAPGSGGNSTYLIEREDTRLFARLHGFAAVGYQHPFPAGSIDSMLQQFGQMTNHPELSTLPLVMYGFSAGSGSVTTHANSHADHIIAMIPDASAAPDQLNTAARKIPSIYLLGERETGADTKQASMETVRTAGGTVAFFTKQGLSHTPMGTDVLCFPFFQRAIANRFADYTMPLDGPTVANGWLLDNATLAVNGVTIVNPSAKFSATAGYSGDPIKASWLIDQETAMLAAAYATYGKSIAVSPVPHGKPGENRDIAIRVRADAADWTEIKVYDFAAVLTTLHPSDDLHFAWNSIPAGVHALIARMTRGGQEYTSFPVTVMMVP